MDTEIRDAAPSDIKDIKKILSYYYFDTENVEKKLQGIVVAVFEKKIVGCACLDTDDITELTNIAVLPGYRFKGIGSKLVRSVLDRASGHGKPVHIRTTSPVFFEKHGFTRLQNDEKKFIFKECAKCAKFDICKQAVMKIDPLQGSDHND